MGTQGMKASLISREVIADSVELVARGNLFDGLVAIAGCDKNMPGTVMALCRLDIPSLMLYGGSIAPGHVTRRQRSTSPSRMCSKASARMRAGQIDDAALEVLEAAACPGAGACGGQFTANTMAMACEFLGISPISLSGVAGALARQACGLARSRRTGDGGRAQRSAAQQAHHPQWHRECYRQRCRIRRLDQCRAALPRHRARDGHRAVDRRLRPHQRTHSAALRSEARRQLRRCRLSGGRRKPSAGEAPARSGPASMATRINVTGHTLAEEAALAVETPGQVVIRPIERSHQAHRRPGHPQGQSRARGRA